MSQYEDRLKDYVDVKERIRLFYEKHPEGRLVTSEVRFTGPDTPPDGVSRVLVEAKAYRTPDDPLPATGWSWMNLPGTTSFTRGSELENTETSAWGRAIGALGIGIDKSIASANEVANKQDDAPLTPASQNAKERKQLADAELHRVNDGSLIGTGELAKDYLDFLPKQTPDGPGLAFKLMSDAGSIKVLVTGTLAEVLPTLRDEIIGKRISCWGRVVDIPYTGKRKDGTTFSKPYQALVLERIKTESGTLPMVEAPSVQMFEGME